MQLSVPSSDTFMYICMYARACVCVCVYAPTMHELCGLESNGNDKLTHLLGPKPRKLQEREEGETRCSGCEFSADSAGLAGRSRMSRECPLHASSIGKSRHVGSSERCEASKPVASPRRLYIRRSGTGSVGTEMYVHLVDGATHHLSR